MIGWCKLTHVIRVAPILKDAISSGQINLTAIANTHQYASLAIAGMHQTDI